MVTGLTSTTWRVLLPLMMGDAALLTKVAGGSGMAAGGGVVALSGFGTGLQPPKVLRAALVAVVDVDFGCAFDVDPEPHAWSETAASTMNTRTCAGTQIRRPVRRTPIPS